MKRVFTASMHHESNSFNPIIAGESEFSVIRGAEIFNRFKENDAATGIIKTLLAAGIRGCAFRFYKRGAER